ARPARAARAAAAKRSRARGRRERSQRARQAGYRGDAAASSGPPRAIPLASPPMRRSPPRWGARGLALAVAGRLATTCAGAVTPDGARWRARDSGASITDLAALAPGWQRTDADGALLAFRSESGGRAAWLHECRGAAATARPEAHALLVRLSGAHVEREG